MKKFNSDKKYEALRQNNKTYIDNLKNPNEELLSYLYNNYGSKTNISISFYDILTAPLTLSRFFSTVVKGCQDELYSEIEKQLLIKTKSKLTKKDIDKKFKDLNNWLELQNKAYYRIEED